MKQTKENKTKEKFYFSPASGTIDTAEGWRSAGTGEFTVDEFIEMGELVEIKNGCLVKFKAVCRWGAETNTRMVKDIVPCIEHGVMAFWVVVRYAGHSKFYVKPSEITEVIN